MSILKDLETQHGVSQNTSTEGGNNNQQTFNLPVKITGYENNEFFLGERVDTKEMVKVKLRPVQVKGENKRPEVVDFQNKNDRKRYAAPNDTIILFDNAYQEQDGTWNARWANVLHKKRKMEAKVLIMPATIRFVDEPTAKYVQVRAIKALRWVNNIQEFEYHLTKALHPKGGGARPFAYVRLTDNSGEKRIYTISPKMLEQNINEQTMKIPADGSSSYQEFLQDENKSKIILASLEAPEVTVEIFYGSNLYLGGDTRDRYLSTPAIRNIIEPAYFINKENGKDIQNYGYKPTVITVREVDDVAGLMFVSDVKPLVNNSEAISILDLKMD